MSKYTSLKLKDQSFQLTVVGSALSVCWFIGYLFIREYRALGINSSFNAHSCKTKSSLMFLLGKFWTKKIPIAFDYRDDIFKMVYLFFGAI